MVLRIFLFCILSASVACSTSGVNQPKRVSCSGYTVEYQNACKLAMAGQADAMRDMLMFTGTFDGESAFTHAMNLLALSHTQRGIFDQAVKSLPADKKEMVQRSVRGAENTWKLMRHAHS